LLWIRLFWLKKNSTISELNWRIVFKYLLKDISADAKTVMGTVQDNQGWWADDG